MGHVRTFGCIARVTLPGEALGKWEAKDRGALGYLKGTYQLGGTAETEQMF